MPKFKEIIRHYGLHHQTLKWCEEMGELIRAAARMLDDEKQNRMNLIEEMADVLICIEQMKTAWLISDGELERIINEKYDRTLKRIRSENDD